MTNPGLVIVESVCIRSSSENGCVAYALGNAEKNASGGFLLTHVFKQE